MKVEEERDGLQEKYIVEVEGRKELEGKNRVFAIDICFKRPKLLITLYVYQASPTSHHIYQKLSLPIPVLALKSSTYHD